MSRPFQNRADWSSGTCSMRCNAMLDAADAGSVDTLGDTGQPLREWRDGILADLGSPDAVSAQERAIVETGHQDLPHGGDHRPRPTGAASRW